MENREELEKQAIRERCKTDLKFLCTEVLGMDRWQEPFHTDLAHALDVVGRRKLNLEPRGHQKTSFISVGWVIQQILRNPNETILIVSAIWDLSRDILRQISAYLTTGHLPELFGAFKTKDTYWTKDAINVAQRTSLVAKDPTINTAGIDSGKTGTHCSLLVFDDIVSAENVTTKEQINKIRNSFRQCLPLLNPGGRIVIIGTRWAIGDIYGDIIEKDMRSLNGHIFMTEEERKEWRKVLKDDPIPLDTDKANTSRIGSYDVYLRQAIEKDQPIFPLAFTLTDDQLEAERRADPYVKKESLQSVKRSNGPWHWAGQYMNDPVDQDSVEFKSVWFHPIVFSDELHKKLANGRKVLSLDPAFRLKQHNDFSGLVLSNTTADNNVYILEAKQLKVNPERLMAEIFRLYDIYKFNVLVVETAQAQLLLVPLLQAEMRKRNVFFLIEEVSPGSDDNKAARIRGLIPHYAAGRIYHIEGLQDLEAQLTEFPRNSHDDIIDALAYQIPFWRPPMDEGKAVEREREGTWEWWKKKAHKRPLVLGKLFNDLRRR